MKIRLTNKEIVNLFRTLSELQGQLPPKLSYDLAKNREYLGRVVKSLEREDVSYFTNNKRFHEYQKAMQELVNKFSTDDKGKPILQRQPNNPMLQRVIPQDRMPAFMQARDDLEKLFADVLVGADAHQREMDRLMNETTEVELRLIALSSIPKDAIPQSAMNQIFVFVEEEEAKDENVKE